MSPGMGLTDRFTRLAIGVRLSACAITLGSPAMGPSWIGVSALSAAILRPPHALLGAATSPVKRAG